MERSFEIGQVVATAMIVVGLGTVVWAVATKERVEAEKPKIQFSAGGDPSALVDDPPPDEPAETDGVSDAEWEEVLIDVEKVKTDGLVTDVDVSKQIITVSAEKWGALEEARRGELSKRLAIYCGRVSGSDEFKVELKDDTGETIGTFER